MLKSDHAQKVLNPRPGLRQRNKDRKMERIVRAGRALFGQRGFEKTTTRAIATRAGVGAGTFFLYFKEKRELLFHIFNADIDTTTEAAYRSLDTAAPLVDQLDHVYGCYLEYYARDQRLSRVFVKELFFLGLGEHAEMEAATARFLGKLAELVERAQEKGEVDASVVPAMAATHTFGLYFLALVGWLTGRLPSRELTQELLKSHFEQLLRGIARSPRP